jgi:hypothetical protein
MTRPESHIIDSLRTACLCDVGCTDFVAVVVVGADGAEHLALAECVSINDEDVTCDTACSGVAHEQLGPLPLEYTRRITIALRVHRCGRPTKTGAPCRSPVAQPGDLCAWHRTPTHTERKSQ